MASISETEHGSFEVLYRDPSGRQRSRSFKRQTDASRFARAVETDKARGDFLDPRLTRATVGHYAKEWWAAVDVKPKTRDVYEGHLRNCVLPYFETAPVASVDRVTIRAFAKAITDEGMSTSTRDGCIKPRDRQAAGEMHTRTILARRHRRCSQPRS